MTRKPDFKVTFGPFSTMWTFDALTAPAREFVEEHVDLPDYMGTPRHFAADHRPARDLTDGLIGAGFVVDVNGRVFRPVEN